MICKGCGQALAEETAVRMVAQWPFCEACFQQLMTKREEPSLTPERPIEFRCCSLCETPLTEKEGQKIGIWLFCASCLANLAGPVMTEIDEAPEAFAVPEPAEESEPFGRRPDPRTWVGCDGCNRQIPLGGAREVPDGCHYCPECYLSLTTDQETVANESSELQRCEACDRMLPPERLLAVEGFSLCSACLSVDEVLALSIARERHLVRMEAMRRGC